LFPQLSAWSIFPSSMIDTVSMPLQAHTPCGTCFYLHSRAPLRIARKDSIGRHMEKQHFQIMSGVIQAGCLAQPFLAALKLNNAYRSTPKAYLWGWSGKPALASCAGMRSSSSMRKGSKLRSPEVPTVRQILTPAPSIIFWP